ncbi:Chaperonin CPN60 2 [Spatholobus suberectus]|nr:Chaperonin CPN60 2 [Spatholobus suberectus]
MASKPLLCLKLIPPLLTMGIYISLLPNPSKSFPGKEDLERSLHKLSKELEETQEERDKAVQELTHLKQHLLEKAIASLEKLKMANDNEILKSREIIDDLNKKFTNCSHNVIIEKSRGNPWIMKDGVAVAKSIKFTDKAKSVGADFVKHVTKATNAVVGDGKTCATVLTQTILTEGLGCKSIATGVNVYGFM